MGGRGSGQHNNHHCKYQVAEVLDGDGLPVYVTMQRAGESFVGHGVVVPASDRQSIHGVAPHVGGPAAIPRAAGQGRATAPAGRVDTHAVSPGRDCADGRQLAGRAGLRFVASARTVAACIMGGQSAASGAMWSSGSPASKKRPARQKPAVTTVEERMESGHADEEGWSWWDDKRRELVHLTARERLRSCVLASCGVLATEAVAESQHSKNDGILRFDYRGKHALKTGLNGASIDRETN